MKMSTCCSAPPDDTFGITDGDGICSACKEHTEFYDDEKGENDD